MIPQQRTAFADEVLQRQTQTVLEQHQQAVDQTSVAKTYISFFTTMTNMTIINEELFDTCDKYHNRSRYHLEKLYLHLLFLNTVT